MANKPCPSCGRLAPKWRGLVALEAAESILWMAEAYAEAGGSRGPEMRDYRAAEETIRAALAELRGGAA